MPPVFYSSLARPVKLTVCSPWLRTAVPLILAAVCYWNGLGGELVHDDIFAIKDNADLRPSAAISELFWNDFWGKPMSSNVSHKSYRPLVALTFRLNYALHELRPWGYHAANVALHMSVTALFGHFCRVMVFHGCSDLAFLAALLFAAHPVHTEAKFYTRLSRLGLVNLIAQSKLNYSRLLKEWSDERFRSNIISDPHQDIDVASSYSSPVGTLAEQNENLAHLHLAYDVTGVVGRADVLAGLFFLLALLAYRGSVLEEGQGGAGRWIKEVNISRFAMEHHARLRCCPSSDVVFQELLLSVVCGCVATLCKEHGVTVFGVCFAYDLLIASRRAIESSIKARNPCSPGVLQLVARMAVVGVLIAPLLIFRIMILPGPLKTPQFSAQDNPASFADHHQTRILSYSYLYYFNAKLLVAPITLCYDWQMGSIPLVESVMDPRNAGTVAFFVYLCALSVFCLLGKASSRQTSPLLGLLLLVIPFLPAANILLRVGFVVAERILYIPSMGYCVLVVSGVRALSGLGRGRPPSSSSPSPSTLPFYLTLALVALFGMRTITRNPVWHTRESLFKSGLETVPNNAKIHFNYGNFLRDSQRTEEAIQHYRTAISLAPDHAVSHNNLGTLLELEEAEFHFREAVRHNPQHHRAFYNLGRNLEMRGRVAEAEAAYKESININPTYSDALVGIAMVMAESGRVEEGWEYMRRATEAAPDKPDMHNNLGAYLLKMNRTSEAIAAYEKTLQLSPRHTTALTSLARIYRKLGRNDRAEENFKRALSIDRDPSTLHYLGALYFNTGKYAEAVTSFREAVSIDQARVDSSCSYAQALIQLGKENEAIKVLAQAIEVHPSAACPHVVLANVFARQNLLQKALEHSSMAIKLSAPSEAAEAYHLQGGALKDLGRLQEAEESYRRAVSLAPHMAAARINLGAVLHMQSNYSAAREQYQAALRLDPSNKPLIHENLKKLDRVQKLAK